MIFPNKKFDIIYADPPWQYDFASTNNRKIENQYPTMTVEEICNLQIPVKENAILYLWATAPKLIEALQVMKAWGFEYKSHAIWDKMIIGMGYWFRGRHELLMVGVKGKMSPPEQALRIDSIYREKRTEHSSKPFKIRELINQWYPLPMEKIELFCRESIDGWSVWGNEVDRKKMPNLF